MFTDRNGTAWRNLKEQVEKNKVDITKIIEDNTIIAEFGIKVINVSLDGTPPIDPPTLEEGDLVTFGYSWLVATGTLDAGGSMIYNLYIWTRLEIASDAGWVNVGEFPKRGPIGLTGATGSTGATGAKGDTGERGNKIYFQNNLPISDTIDGDLCIMSSFDNYRYNGVQWSLIGNTKGSQGVPGETGASGYTPYIQGGYWFINGVDTGVKAVGQDGTSINIQTGVYTPSTLPNFSATSVNDAFVVDDPNTVQAYDLYIHGFGGVTWTIIEDWGGIQGEQGPKGLNPKGSWVSGTTYAIDDVVTYNGSAYLSLTAHSGTTAPSSDTTNWILFVSKGDTGVGTFSANKILVSGSSDGGVLREGPAFGAANTVLVGQGASTLPAFKTKDEAGLELVSRKISVWGTPTNTEYPSAKLVKDSLDSITDELNDKQDKLTTGSGITITDDTIALSSATQTTIGFAESERQKSKNLFYIENYSSTANGITINNNNSTQVISLSGTASSAVGFDISSVDMSLKANKTYTLSLSKSGTISGVGFYYIYLQNANTSWDYYIRSDNTSLTITPLTDITFTKINVAIENGVVLNNYTLQVQLEEGTTATSYQPYNGAIVHQKELQTSLGFKEVAYGTWDGDNTVNINESTLTTLQQYFNYFESMSSKCFFCNIGNSVSNNFKTLVNNPSGMGDYTDCYIKKFGQGCYELYALGLYFSKFALGYIIYDNSTYTFTGWEVKTGS